MSFLNFMRSIFEAAPDVPRAKAPSISKKSGIFTKRLRDKAGKVKRLREYYQHQYGQNRPKYLRIVASQGMMTWKEFREYRHLRLAANGGE